MYCCIVFFFSSSDNNAFAGRRADPGPRNELMGKHLSHKAALGAMQLVLGLCGVALIIYVPIAFPCDESLAAIAVRFLLLLAFCGGAMIAIGVL